MCMIRMKEEGDRFLQTDLTVELPRVTGFKFLIPNFLTSNFHSTPRSDWLLTSPYSNILELNIKDIRIKEMIINSRNSGLSNKFSLSVPLQM